MYIVQCGRHNAITTVHNMHHIMLLVLYTGYILPVFQVQTEGLLDVQYIVHSNYKPPKGGQIGERLVVLCREAGFSPGIV